MPLPAAAAAAITAIGLIADGLGIYSFFASADSDEERENDLNEIKANLSALQNVPTITINSNIAQSLGQADTALDNLALYRTTEDSATRAVLANNAILASQDALNEIKSQVDATYQNAPMEALSYAFGALHYAIAVRMMVANAVQDGPLGATGLHLSIKEAAEYLTSITNLRVDLVSEMEERIGSSISGDSDLSFLGGSVDVVVTSSLTGDTRSFTMERESGFRDTFPFLPFRESDDDFQDRINDRYQDVAEDLYRDIRDDLNIQAYRNTGGDVNQWLAQSELNVSDLYEQVGSNAVDDIVSGTSRADYFTGLGGDDMYFGGNGPDGISGGSGNDILRGGFSQDMLRGGPGNDMMFGNETYGDPVDGDTARFAGLSTEYTISGGTQYAVVSGPDGAKDKLFNVEFLRFDDIVVALPDASHLDGLGSTRDFDTAERVAMIYEAALDRNGNIDEEGLNFWVRVTERDNLSDTFIAARMMTSPEFTRAYGEVETLTNEQFLDRVYQNVLDRNPDQAGFDFYLDLLDREIIDKARALSDIAISPENTLNSVDPLMSLFESSDGHWQFITDDGMSVA